MVDTAPTANPAAANMYAAMWRSKWGGAVKYPTIAAIELTLPVKIAKGRLRLKTRPISRPNATRFDRA
jgi:hypothetical protein